MKMQDKNSSEVIHCRGNRIKSLLYASNPQFKPNIGFIIYTCRLKTIILTRIHIFLLCLCILQENVCVKDQAKHKPLLLRRLCI